MANETFKLSIKKELKNPFLELGKFSEIFKTYGSQPKTLQNGEFLS